jgi:hypothetical protein
VTVDTPVLYVLQDRMQHTDDEDHLALLFSRQITMRWLHATCMMLMDLPRDHLPYPFLTSFKWNHGYVSDSCETGLRVIEIGLV